jgi:hypothetical protein
MADVTPGIGNGMNEKEPQIRLALMSGKVSG